MKLFEIRSADEKTVLMKAPITTVSETSMSIARSWHQEMVMAYEDEGPDKRRKQWQTSVIGIYEWETDYEADKARLDWLGNHRDLWAHHLQCGPGMLRDAIDAARVKPKSTFTVIERNK